jgi:drug/metabolite transporter (DMT)-like permease
MLYVFLSICCSVIVSILLKLAKRYQIDVFQAITWNYSIAVVLTWIFLKPQLQNLHASPIYLYTALGILLPLLFMVIALCVRFNGIIRTEVAQRLSLFIPIIAAFLLFNERLSLLKIIGISIGFIAIVCSIPWKNKTSPNKKNTPNSWVYLFIVFVGFGLIDIFFKQMALYKAVPYMASLFMVYLIAFVLSLLVLVYRFGAKKAKFTWPHILFGWILGIANFGNILFYIKAHQALAKNPSTVFSAMNIGVIVLGALVGFFMFKEKLSLLNKIGIALALVSIIVISYANIF